MARGAMLKRMVGVLWLHVGVVARQAMGMLENILMFDV